MGSTMSVERKQKYTLFKKQMYNEHIKVYFILFTTAAAV